LVFDAQKNESGKGLFLSGRDANWLQIGSSIFSSKIVRTPCRLAGRRLCHRHGDGPLGNARVLILIWLALCRSMTG